MCCIPFTIVFLGIWRCKYHSEFIQYEIYYQENDSVEISTCIGMALTPKYELGKTVLEGEILHLFEVWISFFWRSVVVLNKVWSLCCVNCRHRRRTVRTEKNRYAVNFRVICWHCSSRLLVGARGSYFDHAEMKMVRSKDTSASAPLLAIRGYHQEHRFADS